ncbi:MAG: hypothetical protein L7F78_20595, partial [Syntrophales bacterium LBB04]|nr:hypothetical protein [Syntrophales bacterium LBB04]
SAAAETADRQAASRPSPAQRLAIPSASRERGKKILATNPQKRVELSPNQIIPMTDEDFKDF